MASPSIMEGLLGASLGPSHRIVDGFNLTYTPPSAIARLSTLSSRLIARSTPSSASIPPNLSPQRLVHILLTIALYAAILAFHVRPTAPLYNKHQRSPRQRALANAILAVHVAGGIFEMLRWQYRSCWESAPVPDAVDLFLALLQAVTSLRLAKYMRRGHPLMTRPTFQAGPIFRFAISFCAWLWADGGLHAGSVATLNGFLWTRAGVAFLGPLMVSRSGEKPKYPEVYNLATFAGVIIAVSDVHIPHATKIYAALVVTVAALNHWVTSQFERKDNWLPKRLLLHLLASCGFAELETINRIAASAASAPSNDRFVPEVLCALSAEPRDD